MTDDRVVWVDLTKCDRETAVKCFEQQRDEVMARVVRLQGELQSINEDRFEDNPIILSMDFTEQLDKYLGCEQEEQIRLYNRALQIIKSSENS
jgi:hypothetical protein